MSQDLVSQALGALRQKNYAAARDFIAAYAEQNDLEFQHYMIKGLSELALNDWLGARDTFAEAVGLFPHQPQLWLNLGVAHENLSEIDDAVDAYEHALDVNKDQADACGNLSNLYRKQGRYEAAEEMAHRAYELGAPKAQALNSLGLAIAKQGRYGAAEKVFQEARQANPADPLILANLANLAVDQLQFDQAWPLFAAARAAKDSAITRRDEGMARLLAGDYMRGWPLYEARLELPDALRVRPTCPRWSGETLTGKRLLLVAEQGYGDAIQFCRYGRFLADRGAELVWLVRQPLKRLFAANLPGQVVAEGETVPLVDYWLPIMSLPWALMKLTPADVSAAPYLQAASEPHLPATGDKPKIGLVWAGSPTHERDRERSLELQQLAPLWEKVPAQFYAPFTGVGLEQITPKIPVMPLGDKITDFADTAALLAQLDCLVTVDTGVAHLAGALGLKTLLLLPHCPDWRWGINGDKTNWYQSVTLYRQSAFGAWTAVIERVAEALVQRNY